MKFLKITILLLLTAVFFQFWNKPSTAKQPRTITAKSRYVVDGDSLYLQGYKPQIRLWGVDAPERNKKGFFAAANELKRLVIGYVLTCNIVDIDRYRRSVARCFLPSGKEINRAMIASGKAKEYKRFTRGFYGY